MLAVKQFLTYTNATPFQHAVAAGLRLPDEYFTGIAATLRAKRDLLADGLRHAGYAVSPAAGTYFTVADASHRLSPGQDAVDFCRALPARVGVAAIPLTAFVSAAHRSDYASLVRFAACKRVEVIAEASARLSRG